MKKRFFSIICLFLISTFILSSCVKRERPQGGFDMMNPPPDGAPHEPMAPPSQGGSNITDEPEAGEHEHSLTKLSQEAPTYETEGKITYKCALCDYFEYTTISKLEHTYSNELMYNETHHWYACLDKGYDDLKSGEKEHDFTKGEVTPATYESEEYTTYLCICGYSKKEVTAPKLEHNYSNRLSYDDTHHWYACTDSGYEKLRKNNEAHIDTNEEILHATTDTTSGLARYTCQICGHVYEKTIYLKTEILSAPSVQESTIYIGQALKEIELVGGEANALGTFVWTNGDQIITESGEYEVAFIPNEIDVYETLNTMVYINANQLSVTVVADESGTTNKTGTTDVYYNSSFTVEITPNNGYKIKEIIVDGISKEITTIVTLENITSSHTIEILFEEIVEESLPFELIYVSGTDNAYIFDGTTLYFGEITEDTVYQISGELNGNIVFDVVNDYKFELGMYGFELSCDQTTPIIALSGDEISLKAKNGYDNYIYDNRDAIDESDTTLYSGAVYSLSDLELCGKGSLTIVSLNNNGVHTKDDLQIKNLTLSVTCVDNALKGNDSVEITNANTTLISKQGDCIKTTNSHINETTLNQKGTISILGGTHNLYSACDAIDSAYNVVIDDQTTVLNIYTDKYSQYSEEITATSQSTYYLRYSNTAYKFSVLYSNSTTGESEWVNVGSDYETVSSSSNRPGGSSTYYYYKFSKLSGYDKITVYMYSSTQEQGQATSYYACSSAKTINDSYDTVALSYRSSSLSVSWTNYSTSSSGTGGMGGMQEGNPDKGDYSTKGIKSANEILINEGTIKINAYDDAIHANNDGGTLENGSTPTGNVTINGGTLSIYSNDDGLHADGKMVITNGIVNVTNAYEGIEGYNITIEGGSVSVITSDDGFNSTATTGAGIEIKGGNVYVYATGDGIDSNSTTSKGAILFSGGTTVVICNSNGNSAIDSDGGYTQSGGRVVAIMTSGGMTSETTNGTTQGMTKKSSLSLSNGGYLVVNVNGEEVLTVKMPCQMSAYVVYISSSSATISSSTTANNSLDSNGVYWS